MKKKAKLVVTMQKTEHVQARKRKNAVLALTILEFNARNLTVFAPQYPRKKLKAMFGVSLSTLDRKLNDLQLKAKKASAGRPSKWKM